MNANTREHMIDNMLLMLSNKMSMDEMLELQDRLVMRVKGPTWAKMRSGEKLNLDEHLQLERTLKSQLPKGMYSELKECAKLFQEEVK